jgi:hypothetical protein
MNTMGSKMFKTFSYLVSLKYLWFVLARVINELNTLAKEAMKQTEKLDEESQRGASLLKFEMEVSV